MVTVDREGGTITSLKQSHGDNGEGGTDNCDRAMVTVERDGGTMVSLCQSHGDSGEGGRDDGFTMTEPWWQWGWMDVGIFPCSNCRLST